MIGIHPIGSESIAVGLGVLTSPSGYSDIYVKQDTIITNVGTGITGGEVIELTASFSVPAQTGVYAIANDVTSIFLDNNLAIGATGISANGSITFDLDYVGNIVQHEGKGSASIELSTGTPVAYVGAYGTGSAAIEMLADFSIVNLPLVGNGSLLFELSVNASPAVVDDNNLPSNSVALELLNMPYVGYSMNTLTRGVTAYTENIGTQVRCLVATPIDDYETQQRALIPDIYFYMRSSGDAIITVLNDETKEFMEVSRIPYDSNAGLKRRRAKMPKGLTGNSNQFFIENSDGEDFQLHTIEPYVIESKRIL